MNLMITLPTSNKCSCVHFVLKNKGLHVNCWLEDNSGFCYLEAPSVVSAVNIRCYRMMAAAHNKMPADKKSKQTSIRVHYQP